MKYVFSSYPECSDNSLVLLSYMLQSELKGKFIWLYNDQESLKKAESKINNYLGEYSQQVVFIAKKSFLGVYHYLTANYSFSTHGIFEQLPILPRHTKVNLWHGMPLKKIGKLVDKNVTIKMSYTLSTAPVFDDIIASVFDVSAPKVLKVGLPRNDLFFKPTSFSLKTLVEQDHKVIVWLPTYRKSEANQTIDGDFNENSIGGFSFDELKTLDTELKICRTILIVKLHPMDSLNECDFVMKFTNIKIINQIAFQQLNVETNEFIKDSDGLITDYSSVYFDYLLTAKPIALINKDSQDYQESRGFVSPLVYEKFTGFMIGDLASFMMFVSTLKTEKLTENRSYYNAYDKNGQNCHTLLQLLKII